MLVALGIAAAVFLVLLSVRQIVIRRLGKVASPWPGAPRSW
jgi:hypothetical protein